MDPFKKNRVTKAQEAVLLPDALDVKHLSLYLQWYEAMVLIRKFEDKAAQLYGQQKISGFCHLYNGQEACIVGAVSALCKGDKYITAYRDHAHPLALGTDPKYIMAELYGKATGIAKGQGGSMHLFDKACHFLGGHGIVGGQVPLGIGIAFAEKYKKTENLCITFMGDGAVRQGVVHEAFNLAMLYHLPVIFVIENNGYAMGTSVERSSNVIDLYKLGQSYDMDATSVNGLCIKEVYHAVQKAARKARKGVPGLLEFVTYRYKGHSMSDPATYRSKDEVATYKAEDPILKLKQFVLENGMITERELKAIDHKIKDKINEAVAFAESSPWPDPVSVYDYVYKQKDYPFLPY
ncbi:pyruvate dehydrogenase (acetyl-transferring) E1 component subunit alpha [Candidatus Cardinium hertigii]|uniref:Pyruvate dehydrogenase E1 component subunit alpha n=1 Tax=Candidatus Cardinium hertigii TaxID=247481 RepID=A0A2Z3LHF2_9BACT|nr:pyruvate dehydrogenase (acetyl-transferring) E1 component subunit alpha [Candidatus Cardinium hertigii]AWN81935.1 Acetoin:2,6-dichlorophenolindophenol oxidoreductase subunit alpha [Candidatus Cardinium hertigii]